MEELTLQLINNSVTFSPENPTATLPSESLKVSLSVFLPRFKLMDSNSPLELVVNEKTSAGFSAEIGCRSPEASNLGVTG